MNCNDALERLTRYLDEELAEVEAAPVREHLLDCQDCRATLQEGKSLQAWFVPTEAVTVPDGFASRVAQRAASGDRGTPVLVPRPQVSTPNVAAMAGGAAVSAEPETDRTNQFVFNAIAIAALVLLAFSIGLRRLELPGGEGMKADDASKENAIEALQELNEDEEPEKREDEE